MNRKINTKEIAFWLFVVMVASFLIAGTIFFQSGSLDEITSGKYNHHIEETMPFSVEAVKVIKIDCDSADVHIIPVDSNEISVHLYGNTGSKDKRNDPKLDAKIENGQLVISVRKPFIIGINLGFFTGITLDVSVPKTYSSDISVNDASGNAKIEGLNLNSLSCSLASGDISIKSVTSKDCALKLMSGNTVLESFSGNLKVNAASGNVSVAYQEFNNNVDISSMSGNVKLTLPSSSEFHLSANALSGNIKNDFPITVSGKEKRSSLEGTVVQDNNKITLKTLSGNIDITQ